MNAPQQQSNDGPLPHEAEEMLLGRMRDQVLDAIRPVVGWPKLKEAQQHKVNNGVEQACRQAIRDAAPVIAGRGFDTIGITVGDINTKGELVVAKLSAERTRDNILGLAEAGRCTLALVNPEIYMGAKPAVVMKDQPDLLPDETPEQRATREANDFEAKEHEANIARARQFKPTDDATTAGGAAAKVIGDLLPPAVKAAADRGRALRLDGGACKIPADLEDKPAEVNEFLKAWEAADREGGAPDLEAPVLEAAEPAKKPKRTGRPKGSSVGERVARNLAAAEGANASGTYEPA